MDTSTTLRFGPGWPRVAALLMALWLVAAAGPPVAAAGDEPKPPGTPSGITLYTSVTQDTVDAVLAAYAEHSPGSQVRVFRAPTGELDARLASESRTGGIAADVLWMSDPLSVQRYEAEGMLTSLDSPAFDVVPDAYRGETFVGTRLLNLVIVAGSDAQDAPTTWAALADDGHARPVALPDPGFAGSAFAALGYFATADDHGMDFYRRLRTNGAVQVSSPGDVLTGVAEGRYSAGISLSKMVRAAADKGAPIRLVWPADGAIVLYSPAAALATSDEPGAASDFVEFLVSREAQAAIAATGWQPVRPDVRWQSEGAASVTPDWAELYGSQEELLDDYRAIFGD